MKAEDLSLNWTLLLKFDFTENAWIKITTHLTALGLAYLRSKA